MPLTDAELHVVSRYERDMLVPAAPRTSLRARFALSLAIALLLLGVAILGLVVVLGTTWILVVAVAVLVGFAYLVIWSLCAMSARLDDREGTR